MKPWAVALGASVVLHGAVLVLVAPEAREVTATPAPAPRKARELTFTRVSLRSSGGSADQVLRTASPPSASVAREEPAPQPLGAPRDGSSAQDAPRPPPAVREGSSVASQDTPRPLGATPETPAAVREEASGSQDTPRPLTSLVDDRGASTASSGVVGRGATGEAGAGSNLPVAPPAGGPAAPDLTGVMHARLAAVADGCYPAAARRFRQRGTVQLSFCADERGGARDTTVTGSSGAELLDAAARTCVVERAAPFPPEAAGRCFSVPVRFGAQ